MHRSLEGRRIVDIGYFFEQVQKSRHNKFDCSFLNMEFVAEYRRGYYSKFKFKCRMCGIISFIKSENTQYLPINQSMVNGSIAIGKFIKLISHVHTHLLHQRII